MPEKPLTVASYAAGASLAAITLVYIFGPTFFLDDQTQTARKQGVVGLLNPANDCFINSILQALAGLGDLRVYLIQELYKRQRGGRDIYIAPTQGEDGTVSSSGHLRRLQGLLDATATQALKSMLDKLNERPLHTKTISAGPFIRGLEQAFNTRLNRQQQDAQELLQLVLERLDDEYEAGVKAREAGRRPTPPESSSNVLTTVESSSVDVIPPMPAELAFPFQGKTETIIKCQTCHFTPKSNASKFFTLTLHVPQSSSTTLDACFDGLTKQEFIDDYCCDRCRLTHAISLRTALRDKSSSTLERKSLLSDIVALQEAAHSDPEKPPSGVELPDMKTVPRRRISKHTRFSQYPRTLVIHLSRSIYAPSSFSQKNTSRVTFPEQLVLGNLSEQGLGLGSGQHKYRLLALVTHHGGHNSGHYETFRRQIIDTPGLPPKSLDPERRGSILTVEQQASSFPSTGEKEAFRTAAGTQLEISVDSRVNNDDSRLAHSDSGLLQSTEPKSKPLAPKSSVSLAREAQERSQRDTRRKKRRDADKWWRMSDEKVKECRTSTVLGMQRDAYLLFYELDE